MSAAAPTDNNNKNDWPSLDDARQLSSRRKHRSSRKSKEEDAAVSSIGLPQIMDSPPQARETPTLAERFARVRETNSLLSASRKQAKVVIESAIAILEMIIESDPQKANDNPEIAKVLQELRSYLDRVFPSKKENSSSDPQTTSGFVNPEIVRTAKSLGDLATLVEEILTTEHRPENDYAKQRLESFQEQLSGLRQNLLNLDRPVSGKIRTLNEHIQKMEANPILLEHFEAIRRYTGMDDDQIGVELSRRDTLLKARKERQDELVSSWILSAVRAASCSWAVSRLELECHLMQDMKDLSEDFDRLLKDVEDTKNDMKRKHREGSWNAAHQRDKLQKRDEFCQRYAQLNHRAAVLKDKVEDLGNDLNRSIEEGSVATNREQLLKDCTFYNQQMALQVRQEAGERFQLLLDDRIAFKKNLDEKWAQLAKKVEYTTPIKIERFGEGAKNNGELPFETTFMAKWTMWKLQHVNKPYTKMS